MRAIENGHFGGVSQITVPLTVSTSSPHPSPPTFSSNGPELYGVGRSLREPPMKSSFYSPRGYCTVIPNLPIVLGPRLQPSNAELHGPSSHNLQDPLYPYTPSSPTSPQTPESQEFQSKGLGQSPSSFRQKYHWQDSSSENHDGALVADDGLSAEILPRIHSTEENVTTATNSAPTIRHEAASTRVNHGSLQTNVNNKLNKFPTLTIFPHQRPRGEVQEMLQSHQLYPVEAKSEASIPASSIYPPSHLPSQTPGSPSAQLRISPRVSLWCSSLIEELFQQKRLT